ncbi:MAG TPA: phosphoribosyl-AMP cyclohydrolase [Spirochaetia bacterium]|nr:phosphoribosyl-AMP cyclohydrolase [Spirochaetia bacterium]
MKTIPDLSFSKLGGIVPVVTVDDDSGEVLMQAFMDREAWQRTLTEGIAHYYSRSRSKIWKKGETSGRIQRVREVFVDCDADSVLLRVFQEGGAACHTGFRSCFHRRVTDSGLETLGEALFDPAKVYGSEDGDEHE